MEAYVILNLNWILYMIRDLSPTGLLKLLYKLFICYNPSSKNTLLY